MKRIGVMAATAMIALLLALTRRRAPLVLPVKLAPLVLRDRWESSR